jgi:hypothetical protein
MLIQAMLIQAMQTQAMQTQAMQTQVMLTHQVPAEMLTHQDPAEMQTQVIIQQDQAVMYPVPDVRIMPLEIHPEAQQVIQTEIVLEI